LEERALPELTPTQGKIYIYIYIERERESTWARAQTRDEGLRSVCWANKNEMWWEDFYAPTNLAFIVGALVELIFLLSPYI
jgi:hypothetical protein